MKAHYAKVLIIDFEDYGIGNFSSCLGDLHGGIATVIEHETVDIGSWYDDHPFNKKDISKEFIEGVFSGSNAIFTERQQKLYNGLINHLAATSYSIWYEDGDNEFEIDSVDICGASLVKLKSESGDFITGDIENIVKQIKKVTYSVEQLVI